MALEAGTRSLAARWYEDARLLGLILGGRLLVNDPQLLQVFEQLLFVFHGHLLELEIEQELLSVLHEKILLDRIEELAAWDPYFLSLVHLFGEEALVDHLQSVADHVVGLLKRSEACQDLVVHSFGEEHLVKWVKLLDKERLFGIDEDEILIVTFLLYWIFSVLCDVNCNLRLSQESAGLLIGRG